MNSASEIAHWADIIKTEADAIQKHVRDSNNESTDSAASKSNLAFQLSYDVEQSRDRIFDAMEQMRATLLGPLPYLMDTMTFGIHIQSSLNFAYKFRVAQKLQPTETISYDELAERCKVPVTSLQQFLRYLITYQIFTEPSVNMVSHNTNSRLLLDVPGLDDMLGMYCEDVAPASMFSAEAMAKWPMSLNSNHTGFAVATNSDKGFFATLAQEPPRVQRFGRCMKMLGASSDMAVSLLLDHLGWEGDQCPRTLVDVGGNRGAIAIQLLNHFPSIESITVQDLPHVVQDATVPEDLKDRLNFVAHDFFKPQILEGRDVYMTRNVLHDWPDHEAAAILKNLAAVLKPSGRIVLNEMCLPDSGTVPAFKDRRLRRTDLTMKYILNGAERDRLQWEKLIERVDSRLVIRKIVSPPQSRLSIIEVVWKEMQ